MYWHGIAAAAAATSSAFQGGRVLPASWRQRIPDARQKVLSFGSTLFESCEPYSWFSTVGCEDSQHTLSKVSSFCAPMTRNCPYSCFMDFLCEVLCTALRWCIGWECFSPFTSAASEEFSTLEIALANIFPGMCSYVWMWRMSITATKMDIPYLLFSCAFFMTSFHSSSSVAFSSGTNIAWDERSFVHTSRFPEACVSEIQISRVFWTIRNSRFPKFADQNHIRSTYFFLPRFTLESISYSSNQKVYLKNFVSQIRCAARRDIVCLLSPSNGIKWRASLGSFHWNEFLRKVVTEYRTPSFHCNTKFNWICFCLRCFGCSPILHPHRVFLLGGVSFNNVNLVK